jgi:hypothetical protein
MIDMNKKYQTRDGRAVRILCVDAPSKLPVVGIVEGEHGVDTWSINGRYFTGASAWDLIPVPTKHEGWCIVKTAPPFFYTHLFLTKEEALKHMSYATEPVALAHVTWED